MKQYSDFRSDTVTRPTPKMREAMAQAEVGDDVLGDDPTVQKLESLAASIMGKEAGLFVPSGTMGNSIAIKVWTKELEEIILESRSHIFNMESTHLAFISRVLPRCLPSQRGAMDPEEVRSNVRQANVHIPQTSLICVENTHNNWSGAVVPLDNLKELRAVADEFGLKIHLDGARIFNASLASGISVKDYAAQADSVMFCLSKGLSAPVGSMVVGPRSFIEMATLTEMVDRLQEDHRRARKFAEAIAPLPGIELDPSLIETNIVIFGFNHPRLSNIEFLAQLQEKGVLALPVGNGIRFVTHKDIDDNDVDRAIEAFKTLLV
ncbi:MAG: threonine aldolase [Candidatus Aminicenantes bacterium 4484_214]|nr:MAG: threonine aldolase [Candidatus Aminicenantes bacterium 4484_214]